MSVPSGEDAFVRRASVRQIYHCFGCGAGGDVFKFVMELDKCTFPEAVRTVAEKCGIAIPKPRKVPRGTPGKPAALRFGGDAPGSGRVFRTAAQGPEGKVAEGYLEDRGLDRAAMKHSGWGLRPLPATLCCGT